MGDESWDGGDGPEGIPEYHPTSGRLIVKPQPFQEYTSVTFKKNYSALPQVGTKFMSSNYLFRGVS